MEVRFRDPAQVAAELRRMHEAGKAQQLAACKTPRQKEGREAFERMFEAMLSLHLHTVEMMNEDRDSVFIGGVLGNVIGNLVINALGGVDDPYACLEAIMRKVDRAVSSFAGSIPKGVSLNTCEVLVHKSGGHS